MEKLFSLEEKNILVTGASSGIGKSVAINTALQGATVTLLARNKERLTATLESLEANENHKAARRTDERSFTRGFSSRI